jgi:hypothetical protein
VPAEQFLVLTPWSDRTSSRPRRTRAEADHETLTGLSQMNKQQLEILEGQSRILELLQTKVV